METIHLLKSLANAAHLAHSIEQYRKGRGKARDLADAWPIRLPRITSDEDGRLFCYNGCKKPPIC
jgi:hypothetical protein